MSTTTPTTSFDLARFTRAAQERDATTQLSMYGPAATVTIVDKVAQPSSPRVLGSRAEIQTWLEDTYGRDMSHTLQSKVGTGDGAAFVLSCRYPDGTAVLCATVIALEDGLIREQTIVQAWDER
jgi:hypothetical protein